MWSISVWFCNRSWCGGGYYCYCWCDVWCLLVLLLLLRLLLPVDVVGFGVTTLFVRHSMRTHQTSNVDFYIIFFSAPRTRTTHKFVVAIHSIRCVYTRNCQIHVSARFHSHFTCPSHTLSHSSTLLFIYLVILIVRRLWLVSAALSTNRMTIENDEFEFGCYRKYMILTMPGCTRCWFNRWMAHWPLRSITIVFSEVWFLLSLLLLLLLLSLLLLLLIHFDCVCVCVCQCIACCILDEMYLLFVSDCVEIETRFSFHMKCVIETIQYNTQIHDEQQQQKKKKHYNN